MDRLFFSFAILLLFGCTDNQSTSVQNEPPEAPKQDIRHTDKWNETTIKKREFKGNYPFTVDEGILRCEFNNGVPLVYFMADGSVYAVNGSAQLASPKLPKMETIWASSTTGGKVNISDVLDFGLSLCDKNPAN